MTLNDLLEKIDFVDHPVKVIHYNTNTEIFTFLNNSIKIDLISQEDLKRKVRHIDVTHHKVLIWVN